MDPPLRFPLGHVVITRNANDVLSQLEVAAGLKRHISCDWGDLCESDRKENDLALTQGLRLLSAYETPSKIRFWIITEADRSVTTILLPEDY